MQNRYSDGIMRTNLEGVTITTPQADLIDDVEVTKEPISHKTIREFDPTLEPGSPDVIVQKVKMENQQQLHQLKLTLIQEM